MNKLIYLDFAATTPVAAEVLAALLPYLTWAGAFANASSIQHVMGQEAESAIKLARRQIAEVFRCAPNDLIFTSGATEANNLAIKSTALRFPKSRNGNYHSEERKKRHIITSTSEHKSVLDCCKHLEDLGFDVTYLRPDNNGIHNVEDILSQIKPETALVSIMHVNNETGVIQPIEQIAQALNGSHILLHVDAAQSAGKLPIDLAHTPIDLLSLSAHKVYGPKGVGCLYIRNRKSLGLASILHGGGQEFGLRPGTLPTHQIVGMAEALRLAAQRQTEDLQHGAALRRLLLKELSQIDDVMLNGCQDKALPTIVNVSFNGVPADALLLALQDRIAISSGSACNSGTIEASHVLRGMGIEGDRLYGAIRISFGRLTSVGDIEQAAQEIGKEVIRIRQLALG